MGIATPVHLTDDERYTLETWVRRTTTEQRMVQRARIVWRRQRERRLRR